MLKKWSYYFYACNDKSNIFKMNIYIVGPLHKFKIFQFSLSVY